MSKNELVTKIASEQSLINGAELSERAKSYLQGALSPSTRKFYRIDFGIFHRWCELSN
jgi:hypothetical protein